MAVHTILLDFTVDVALVKNENQISVVSTNIENILRDFLTNLKEINRIPLEEGLFKLYSCDYGAIVNLRIYNNGLITVNIEYFKDEAEPLLSYEQVRKIEVHVLEQINGILSGRTIVPIKRDMLPRYFSGPGERLLEYDIDDLVFEEKTPFQKVQILHSKSLGHMLVLDDLHNISEADQIYTETLMLKNQENYTDKDIVILGGGDGALLNELLKEGPKEVIMLEIDEVVLRICAKYMRSLCGSVLDRRMGPNYKIIVGDCMKTMDQYINEGRKFDYVFGDLTDVPTTDDGEELWDFFEKVLQKSFKILKPDGKFMSHICGSESDDAIATYERLLTKVQPPVKLSKSKAYIPSFMEDWVFAYVTFEKHQ